MFRDIVMPQNNEAEFIEFADKLGYRKLYFIYDFKDYNEEKIKCKLNPISHNLQIEACFLVNQKNIGKASRQSRLLAAKSSDKDRFFIESKKIKLIYGFEETEKRDFLHQRASGLNHIMCELTKKNEVAIGFSYSSLLNENKASLLIGRMMQNIALCRKYKVKTIIASFSNNPYYMRSPYDLASLFTLLGMDGKKIKESLSSDI